MFLKGIEAIFALFIFATGKFISFSGGFVANIVAAIVLVFLLLLIFKFSDHLLGLINVLSEFMIAAIEAIRTLVIC